MKKPWKRITICLSPEDYFKYRKAAGCLGISMAELVRRLLYSIDLKAIDVKPEEPL